VTSEIAVFNASPLIVFHQIHRLEMLREVFTHVIVADAVAREVAPSLGVLPTWVELRNVQAFPALPQGLGAGERAAIALASDVSADFVVLDDRRARRMATGLGLTAIGSLGLLVRAKRQGLIDKVQPMMEAMIANELFVSNKLRREILELAGEDG
jgi:predicted nucleic acid-binding protein